MMETWESLSREKSRRRASVRPVGSVFGWSLAAVTFVLLVTGLLTLLNALI
jgi:hypothetical protein